MRRMAGLSLMSTNSKTCGVGVWTDMGWAGVGGEIGGVMELEAVGCRVPEADGREPLSGWEVAEDEGWCQACEVGF